VNGTATPEPLRGLPLALAAFAVATASFMNTLDTTIAVVAVPTIAGNLAATPSQGSWVITSYGVCLAVILPLSGWITRRFGEVNTFTASVLMFTVTSWLCGIATGFNELLLFRAMQGIAGGLLLPLSQALLMRLFPLERRGMALGIWALATMVAPVLGPVLGGYITDSWGWPWIFYINIPFGLLCTWLSWSLLRPYESQRRRDPVDRFGLLLLTVGVICFQLTMDRGHELDWLSSTPIAVMLVTSGACFVLFLVWERDEAHPVVDLALFRHRNFLLGTVLMSVMFTVFMVSTVILPIWLQTALGYTATWAGIMMAPTSLAPVLLIPLVGQYVARWDPRVAISLGSAIYTLAFYLHTLVSTQSPPVYFPLIRICLGMIIPFAFMPVLVVSLAGLPHDKLASATGIFNFARMLSASLGVAIGITLWDERTIFHRSRLAEEVSADSPQYHQAMDLLLATLPDPGGALIALENTVSVQARTLAMNDLNYLCGLIALSMTLVAWLLPAREKTAEASP